MKEISDSVGITFYIICALGETLAFNYFCRKTLGAPKWRQIFFITLLLGVRIPMEVFLYKLPCQYDNGSYNILPLLYQIFQIVLILLLFEQEKEKRILAAFLLTAARELLLNFWDSLFSCAALLFLHVVRGEEIPVIDIKAAYNYGMTGIVFLVDILGICRLARRCVSLFTGKERRWYLGMAIPVAVVILMEDLERWGAGHGIMVRSGGDWNLYYDQLFSYMGICLLSALSIFALCVFLFGMDKVYWEQKKRERYQIELMSYQMLEEQYGHMERLRHDFKNHIIAMQGLLENKEWEKMNDYFRQMLKAGEIEKPEEVTGNMAIDALLYQKRKTAEKKGISFEAHMCFLRECPVPSYDLCVFLGNALDNAIEACIKLPAHEKRLIEIKTDRVKKCFLMEIKNSTDMLCLDKMKKTTKQDSREHGIGLLNIKDVVQKYNGVMNIEVKNNFFLLSVLLPLPLPQADTVHNGEKTL